MRKNRIFRAFAASVLSISLLFNASFAAAAAETIDPGEISEIEEAALMESEADKGEAAPSENEAKAASGNAAPSENEAKAASGNAAPSENEAKPALGDAALSENEATPASGNAAPSENEAKSVSDDLVLGGSGFENSASQNASPNEGFFDIMAMAEEPLSEYDRNWEIHKVDALLAGVVLDDEEYAVRNARIQSMSEADSRGPIEDGINPNEEDPEISPMAAAESFTVVFYTFGGGYVPDQTVKYGGLVTRPADPSKLGYKFLGWYSDSTYNNLWNFETSRVYRDIDLYARYEALDGFIADAQVLSSTGKVGSYVSTVIGQGCTVKLALANSEGGKIKYNKKDVKWSAVAYDGTKASDYITVKNGVVKCKKTAPTGYRATVIGEYSASRVYYSMEVMHRIKKFGYYDAKRKFKSSYEKKVTTGSYCDYGYGPWHFIGSYPHYYDGKKNSLGSVVYEDPTGLYWQEALNPPESGAWRYACGVKLPKKAKVNTRLAKNYYGGYSTLYYFTASKPGSYKVAYLAPDGSGKKFVLNFKAKKKWK
ncbi:MAG: InlB B-repeat-containing protein [Lachnospiraceae bacterium]|nr:InlB B-repeat-containing protein [Lachnospiraceae bacterium]